MIRKDFQHLSLQRKRMSRSRVHSGGDGSPNIPDPRPNSPPEPWSRAVRVGFFSPRNALRLAKLSVRTIHTVERANIRSVRKGKRNSRKNTIKTRKRPPD